jgi:hypothetical protein
MKVKQIIAVIITIFCLSSVVFSEEGTGTLIKQITPKPKTEVTYLISDGEDIDAAFGDGSVLKFSKELDPKGEIAKAGSAITSIALSQNKQNLAIAASSHGTMRYEKESYRGSSYKQSTIRFGYPTSPIKGLAFDPSGAYLITTDSAGRGLIYLNEDNKEANSGNGNLIGPIFTDGTKVLGAIPFGEAMIYLSPNKISAYNYTWNIPSYEAEKEPAKAEKGPELLQNTETVIVNVSAVCAALGPSRASLYYVTRDATEYRLYKYVFNDKKTTLLYVFDRQINSIATYDGMDIYLAISDQIAIVREEHTVINIENRSDVQVSLYINGSYERYISSKEKIELIRRPGSFRPTVTASSAIVYFDDYDNGETTLNLKNKDVVNLTVQRQYPLQIIPVANIQKSHDMAISEEHNVLASTFNNINGQSLLVLDSGNHKLLYQLDYSHAISPPLFHGNYVFVAEQNSAYAYGIKSGKQEFSWQAAGDIKALTAFGNKIAALSSHAIELFDVGNNSRLTFSDDDDREINLTACLTDEKTFIISKSASTEVYKIVDGEASLYHRIPRSWTGNIRNIIPMRNGAFALLRTDNRLQTYTGDPDQIEPISFQMNKSLEFQYSFTKSGLIFLRFIDRSQNRIEDYDIEIPGKMVNYFYIDPKIINVYGTGNTMLGKTESSVILYSNERSRGTYYFFEGFKSAFITPGNSRENDKYYPGSDSFDPVKNFRIRQNRDERDFMPDDKAKTIGGQP